MKLSKQKLQELKDKKIQIEDLNNLYFIDSKNHVIVENILSLLDNNICDFKEIIDKVDEPFTDNVRKLAKSPNLLKCLIEKTSFQKIIKIFSDFYAFDCLVSNTNLFEELTKNDKLTQEDLKYLFDVIVDRAHLIDGDHSYELTCLCRNTPLIKKYSSNLC